MTMTTAAPSVRRFPCHTPVQLAWTRCHQEPMRMPMLCGLLSASARDMPEWRGTTDDGRRTTRRRRRREDGGGAKGKDLTKTVLSHVDATCADHAVKALMEVNNISRAVPDFFSAISTVLAQIDQKGPKKEKSQKSNTSRTPPPILGDFRKFC